jgi:hypothetical protein
MAIKSKIVIIDDSIQSSDDEAYIFELEQIYGKENIHIFQAPDEGIRFIELNRTQKIIVLLDIMFGRKPLPLGLQVFDRISSKTSLVCFIIMSNNIEKLDPVQMVKLVNNHAWHIASRDESTENILKMVSNAENEMSTRIDAALEEWIAQLDEEERNKPIMATRQGQEWSLNDMLREIRLQSEEGIRIEKNIITLTLDLITRGKRSLNA